MLVRARDSVIRLVKPDRNVASEILVRVRYSLSKLVKPDRGVASEIFGLKESRRYVRLVKPDKGVTSVMVL